MSNPTSNFGWQMPTATDLVTDLPADFEVFGQAVDTALMDLKGGTTGQVLSKTSNTDMDFTWVAQDDSNAIQNAIVDAKGDLIAATAADTPARLAIGTNGQVLTADSTAATGMKWASAGAGFAGCVAYKTTTQTVSTDTLTAITFDSELFDTDGFHSTSSNTSRFTIPTGKDGKYNMGINFTDIGTGQAGSIIYLLIYKNGTLITSYQTFYNKGTNDYAAWSNSYVVTGVAGDYFEFFTKNNVQQAKPYADHTAASFYYLGA
jgi:hypothetical protein